MTAGCRGCGSGTPVQVVDLGRQPASDSFPPEREEGPDAAWPLGLWSCPACGLVQLGPGAPVLPQPPLAVESRTSREHAAAVVRTLLDDRPELRTGSYAEFASHHGGRWSSGLEAGGLHEADPGRPADLVVDVHGLAHEPDLGAALDRRAWRLARHGLLVLEAHHLLPLVTRTQFDTVRHGHFSYLSLAALSALAAARGLAVLDAVAAPVFGGSLLVTLGGPDRAEAPAPGVAAVLEQERAAGLHRPEVLTSLEGRARVAAADLHERLVDLRRSGRTVLGYGAPSKAAVLLGAAGITTELLPFTVDASAAKHGLRVPGSGVPVRPVEDLRAARPDVVLLLTWDIADEVVADLERDGGWGATYLVPAGEDVTA
ncbi:MAG TPA: methyltransferase C-terminal domain-containing protein [Jiangellales bacterium]|nr:methyltransferase C-terminal domain-containing protein [Jiangellales bacterium]